MNREQEIVVGRITKLLESAARPWCVQCREKMKRCGFDRNGGQRWKCGTCNITYGLPQFHKDKLSKPAYKPERLESARILFLQGYSIRQVMREVGLSKQTAHQYRKRSVTDDIRCQCGASVLHRGWCWWRYKQSPKRQEVVRKWHE